MARGGLQFVVDRSGSRGSGCRCTGTRSSRRRSGRASRCCRSSRASSLAGAVLRLLLRPLRCAPVRDRGHGDLDGCFVLLLVLPVDFRVPGVRLRAVPGRRRHGPVRLAEPRRRDEQPAAPRERGVGGGMNSTFLNAASVFSIGIFFTLMIVGLAAKPPRRAADGTRGARRRRGRRDAARRQLPPVVDLSPRSSATTRSSTLLGPHVLAGLSAPDHAAAHRPLLLPAADRGAVPTGLHWAFAFAIVACLLAAAASSMRGGRHEPEQAATATSLTTRPVPVAGRGATARPEEQHAS